MLLLIDNYDSFTFNLVQHLGVLGKEIVVKRNDALSAEEAISMKPDHIVLSPGPCGPKEAGICVDLIKKAAETGTPLLGVCLGHQAIGYAFGGNVIRAPSPMHGKVGMIRHEGKGILRYLPSPFPAARYHSLIVAQDDSWPSDLELTAISEDDNLCMGLMHKSLPIHGVQFHPESIATECGHAILKNFISFART